MSILYQLFVLDKSFTKSLLFYYNLICYNYPMKPKPTKAEKREAKKKPEMPVSGKSVLKIKEIILNKAKKSKRG